MADFAESYDASKTDLTKLDWYDAELTNVAEPARKLLETYSGIPPEDVVPHIVKVRNNAFAIFPYPCLGKFRFLDLHLRSTSQYPEILSRIKGGEKLLDMGCCFGQELRQLAADGAPSENLYGSDLRMDFMNLGYDLFLDQGKLKSTFLAADIFNPLESGSLAPLVSQISIIHSSSFFHLFDLPSHITIAKAFIQLLKPVPGVMILGRQIGNVNPREYARRSGQGTRFRHDAKSWEEMWEKVGTETGTKWKVDAKINSEDEKVFDREKESGEGGWRTWNMKGTRRLYWSVQRVE